MILPSALEEWENLNNSIKPLFKKKLQERLNNPHVLASRLRGFENHYKIKLKKAGFRLVYEVLDEENYVLVIASVCVLRTVNPYTLYNKWCVGRTLH
ncbi:MAG: type II toxin-antitoxin system RelE/ParE family toxin [Pseudomonadota bacterium]